MALVEQIVMIVGKCYVQLTSTCYLVSAFVHLCHFLNFIIFIIFNFIIFCPFLIYIFL